MSEDATTKLEQDWTKYLRARVSRSQLLAATGAGIVLAAAPRIAGAQATTPESVQTIINIADTAEHLAVTVLTAAVNNAATLGLSGVFLAIIQAALAEEQYHADFLEANGAKTLTDTFTVPDPKILTDLQTFLKTIEAAEGIFIAAYMAAVREFTQLGQPTLAKYAYQIGTVEAEHRAAARAAQALTTSLAAGVPPNNLGFEVNMFNTVGDAAAKLTALGFIGGSGTQAMYPGRAAALAAAAPVLSSVIETTPSNSTPTAAYPVYPATGGGMSRARAR